MGREDAEAVGNGDASRPVLHIVTAVDITEDVPLTRIA